MRSRSAGTSTAAMERVDVVVVGAGQAGLATSYELTRAGVEHLVLERDRIGQTWRGRWDSFCLVTPNWTVRLPGWPYQGDDPDGFMAKDELVAYLEAYAASFAAPVREGVEVTGLTAAPGGGFLLETSAGGLHAGVVVVATGAYQRPHRPPVAATLPVEVTQLDVDDYRNPHALPPGKVLVVGSGQSGAQLAEELCQAGRDVVLACGKAPWAPRRLGGLDIFWWVVESGFIGTPVAALPSPAARLAANPLVSGHDGGHDLHLRTLQAMGVTLTGRFLGVSDQQAWFAPDLGDSLAWGDARHRQLMELFAKTAAERGLQAPQAPQPEPFDATAPDRLPPAGLGAVIFASGFRCDYGAWVRWPEAFDELGFPVHHDGASTMIDGLYFVGVHFLRTRKSALLLGVGDDAALVARDVAARVTTAPRGPRP
jgi:Pyridine nucleotide-disulphide oxidoreductase